MQSIYIKAKTLPEGWEQALVKTWEVGSSFPTEYDKPGDPNSRDVTAMIHIESPMSDPRLHRSFPGGLDDLEKYRSEVLYGVHDHWVNPKEGKWEYTYHERLFEYQVPSGEEIRSNDGTSSPEILSFNQIALMIEKLKQAPHTRRAQAVTWKVWEDTNISDPSCLQRIWCRVDVSSGIPLLCMNVHMRSNDAYKAAFMNMYGFTELQDMMAKKLGVGVGDYIHIADSFHIYGSYFDEFEGFLKTVSSRPWNERVLDVNGVLPGTSEKISQIFAEGCDVLLAESDMPANKKEIVKQRKQELLNGY